MREIHEHLRPACCPTRDGQSSPSAGAQTVLILCDDKLGCADKAIAERLGISSLVCPVCERSHIRLAAASDLSAALCVGASAAALRTVEPSVSRGGGKDAVPSLVCNDRQRSQIAHGSRGWGEVVVRLPVRGAGTIGEAGCVSSAEETHDARVNTRISESLLKWASARESNAHSSIERKNAEYRARAYRRAAQVSLSVSVCLCLSLSVSVCLCL